MRIFAIRDEMDPLKKDIAYLFYYELGQNFYIELPDDADPWNTPLILSSILKRGTKTVNAYWSRVWVRQRIIPSDRQNLGQILKENGMTSYDEFKLLLLSEGRCSQDNFYIAEIDLEDIPACFAERLERRVEDVIPLAGKALLVLFRNGEVKRCDLQQMLSSDSSLKPLQNSDALFSDVEVQVGGYGICWGEQIVIPDSVLYRMGEVVPLSQKDFISFVQQRVVDTAEAAELLHCTKQNIDDLTRRGKLHPIRSSPKNKLYIKSEILQRLWH